MTFYNSCGKPIAYTEDGENIFLFSGEPVAYLFGELVYAFDGRQLGRFANGWVRDKEGRCVFYTENAGDSGPVQPNKQIMPVKCIKHIMPVKCSRHVPLVKAIDNLAWSNLSGEQFFK